MTPALKLRPPAISGMTSALAAVKPSAGVRSVGQIGKLVGLTIESSGPIASVGDLVAIIGEGGQQFPAEVIGFRDSRLLLLPFEEINGIRCGDRVLRANEGFCIGVGEGLIGRVMDPLGQPLDGLGPLPPGTPWPVRRPAPESLRRQRVVEPLDTGVRAIDGLLTCGRGQRLGVFAGSGVGKSTLLGMMCRNAKSDVNVVGLIGERGKEVRDFLEDTLGPEGLARSVVVVASADKPPLQRVKGAETTMAIAEYFRSLGRNVLLVMDSLTRYAMALREIGLAAGEPPATRGYPPSVFSLVPGLLERAGADHQGSITGIFTVLVEGDDMNDPVADMARGSLDGHIVLSRELASRGLFPPIDVLGSLSRVMNRVVSAEQVELARELREIMVVYRKAEDMINLGAYKDGNNPRIDRAISKKEAIDDFLRQDFRERVPADRTIAELRGIVEE